MLYRLKRHPLPIVAHFRHSLVLAYAFPQEVLAPLLPPGLMLDTHGKHGFVAVAMVQTERLRPAFVPRVLGVDFFLTGYRIFVRLEEKESLRGLYILRSDTDRRTMVVFGNLLTHYRYRQASVEVSERTSELEIRVRTPRREADLHVLADLRSRPAPPPPGSPFSDEQEARRFAGPLPYTFDHERETRSFVAIRATRSRWDPESVSVEVRENTFLESAPFADAPAVLANAFYVSGVDYRWERGEVMRGLVAGSAES